MNIRNTVSGVLCVGFAGYVYWLSGTIPSGVALDPLGGAFLPRALAVALGLFGGALAITGLLGIQVRSAQAAAPIVASSKKADVVSEDESGSDGAARDDSGSHLRVLAYAAAMGLYVWLLPLTGFVATSFLFFTVFIYLLGQRNVVRALIVSAFLTGGLYGLFGILFGVRLPTGSVF